jgi:hypothetical protein
MEAVVTIEPASTIEMQGGNVRYSGRDRDGKEYATFREAIGSRAAKLEGRRARIEYHEAQRGRYTNVYLDKVEPLPREAAGGEASETGPTREAWRTAVEAAPWLAGESDPHAKTSPEELYETLKPFKDDVAEDIRQSHPDRR